MLDFSSLQNRIELIDREDRALLRSNPSAWSMPKDGQEHVHSHMLLPSRSSFGRKAINLLSWCKAPTKVKQVNDRPLVGHMSVFNVHRQIVSDIDRYLVIWMPQRKFFMATKILLFDFELFIGVHNLHC
jgi:hypothetical protein